MKIYLLVLALVTTTMSDSRTGELLKIGNDQFTANFFNEVTKSETDKSFVISAFSVLFPLAQLALASIGSSHDEILTAIGMPDDNVTKEVFFEQTKRLRSVQGVELKLANKIYIRNNYELNDEFKTVSKNVFNSEVQNIDFVDQQGAANEINTWVEDHTNKRIKNLVDPSTLNNRTAAILVNAIFFKGNWKTPFEKESTVDRDFFITKDNKVIVPMMHQTEYFKYGESEDIGAKFLEMPYEGDETSFVIVLPNEYDGIDSLVEKLKDPFIFSKGRNSMYYTNVHVSIPKFKIETKTDLKEVLQKINVIKLFNKDQAHLDNLIKGEENISVSDAVQKAFIEVDETGTEAAAANKFGLVFATSIGGPSIKSFVADHPFAFFLLQKNNILFNGLYRS